jgi:hypothetical protein
VVELSLPDLPVLSDTERSCLARYVGVLVQTLDERLEEIVVFGELRPERGVAARVEDDAARLSVAVVGSERVTVPNRGGSVKRANPYTAYRIPVSNQRRRCWRAPARTMME